MLGGKAVPLRVLTDELFDVYKRVLDQAELASVVGFERFFREHPPATDAAGYKFVRIRSLASFDAIGRTSGLYMIASDFVPDLNRSEGCSLRIDDLSVIYRGQAHNVRERVRSHLDNTRYKQLKEKKKQDIWTRCLKLDRSPGNGGIDFDTDPYLGYRWVVLVLPLQNSRTEFRNYAEWGFDEVFGKPIASNEKSKRPSKPALDEARAKLAYSTLNCTAFVQHAAV